MGLRVGAAGQPLLVDPRLDPAHLEHVVGGDALARGSAAGRSAPRTVAAARGPRRRRRRAAAPATPRPSTTWRSRRRTSRGSAPAAPCLPSGRRSASTCSAGSAPGSESSRRSSLATAVAYDDARLRVGARLRVVDEEHVGVAAVGQLEAAVAAHRHDGHPGRRVLDPALLAHRAAGDAEGGLQGGVGQPREARAHVGHVDRGPAGRPRRSGRARGGGSRGPPGSPSRGRPGGATRRASPRSAPRPRAAPGPPPASAPPAARARAGWWRSGRWRAAGPAARRPRPRRAAS